MSTPSGNDGADAKNTTQESTSNNVTEEAQNASSSSGGGKLPIPINLPGWAMWAIGAVVLLAIPFYTKVLKVEGGLGKVVKAMADDVELVAPIVKTVVEEIAESLPEDSKFAHELQSIEKLSDEVSEGAEKVEAFVEKIEDIKEKIRE